MRLSRPLPSLPTLVLLCTCLIALGAALWLGSAPAAHAQDGDFVIVVPPVEVESTEIATTVIRVSPGSKAVAAVTVIVEFPSIVAPTVAEPLVSGFCEITDNSVRFSGFEVAGWSSPTDLCQITLRGTATSGSDTPTVTITVAADTATERLTGTGDPGLVAVIAPAPARPPVVTATPEPTPEATSEPEPTEVPVEEPTPTPDETEPTPAPTTQPTTEAATNDSAANEPANEDPDTTSSTDDQSGDEGADAADPTDAATTGSDEDSADDDTADDDTADGTTSAAPEDEAPTDEPTPDSDADTTEGAETAGANETASPTPPPPLPTEGTNRAPLILGVAAALTAAGALLGLGTRKANRDPGTLR